MNFLSEISKHRVEDWHVEHAPANPIILSGVAKGFTHKLNPKEYSIIICYFKNREVDWITLFEDQNKVGELIFKKYEKNKNYWEKRFNNYLKIRKEIEDNFRGIKDKDISKISDKEILKEIKKYIELQLKERRVSNPADPFIFYSERKLNNALRDFKDKNPDLSININEAGEILTRPEDSSFLNEAESELINIAKEAKKENIGQTELQKLILNHIDKYCWIKGSFLGSKEYTFEDAFAELSALSKTDLEEESRKNQLWRDNAKIKKEYILKYKFNDEILSVADLSSVFAKWQDVRKESTLINAYLHTKFLKELSRRKKANESSLAMLADYSEIENFIRGKIDGKELNKRKEGCLIVFKKDEFKVFYDNTAISMVEKIINIEDQDIKEIKGTVASSGMAIGKVRIVINEKDVVLFQKDEILVSTMTRPDHILALKKAKAIVTNEGGITCHAAIVSRELGIPCIIGTKIATKVLHDGQMVEVNANKGIVKILKK